MERAREASIALRELDQEAVDRIVWAMTVAGLEHAVELAELAMEETHFGVLEDKVLKNYIATEFLYDYLKDKKSVGVIDEDRERALQYVAEPIGVVLALLPITNPTSTTLFKSIVCAKTRNALIMRPSPRAAHCARRAAEVLQEAGEAVGLPPNSLQVIPDPSLEVSQYLFHHPGVDFIWTTGGPEGGGGRERRRQAVPQRRRRQRAGVRAPQRRHPDGGHGHPDLEDVRLVGHLPRGADVRDRRCDLRSGDRGVPADGRPAADRRADGERWRLVRSPTKARCSSTSSGSLASTSRGLAGFEAADERQGAAGPAADATSTRSPRTRSSPRS